VSGYSDQPDPPEWYQVVQTDDCVRYTDPSQAQWFFDRINFEYGSTTPNVRFDDDGTTIRWFGFYVLHLGDWLWKGTYGMTDEQFRGSVLRPVLDTVPPDSTGA
jgi:hypothetical protein